MTGACVVLLLSHNREALSPTSGDVVHGEATDLSEQRLLSDHREAFEISNFIFLRRLIQSQTP
ncbi:MAG: hypothetical protein RBU37_00245 [Myxococcota bacterium]|nr:hypothetical protein [Myxococcota bacterium]